MILWMRRYRNDSDLLRLRPVEPEYSVCCRCRLFGIGFKDFFSMRPLQTCEFMGHQTWMPRVFRQELYGFRDGFVSLRKTFVRLEFSEFLSCLVSDEDLKQCTS